MKKIIRLIVMASILAIGALAAVAWPSSDIVLEAQDRGGDYVPFCGSDIFEPDELPVTLANVKKDTGQEKVTIDPLSKHQLQIIGRLADGIANYKKDGWWECGELMDGEKEIEDRALFYAYEIVRAADEVSDESDDAGFTLNPWGLAGTIRNESQFDRCALGTHPRKTAYRLGILKKKKRCISHTEDEILAVVQNEDMNTYYNKSGFDLGTAQLLSRFYSNPRDFANMLSVRGSATEAAYAMRKRGRIFKSKRPWLYWRGYRCEWYDAKITRWARQLGAQSNEI